MGFDDRPRDLAERLYRWALVVYPAVFRRQYGPDMVEMFRDARRARVRTGSSALGLWAKTMRDLVANAAMMRLASWRKPLTPTNTVLATLSTTGFHSTRSRLMGSLIQDGRFALRTLWKNRGFTAVAVVTIALGIGANSAIFTVVNAVLLRPLAYPAPERLVVMWTQLPQDNQFTFPVSQAEYYDYREESELFQDMGAYFSNVVTVTGEGDAQRVAATGASASLLQILGLRAAVGRLYRAEEDRANTNPIVVLGHDFWTRQFGADPAVVGRQITVNGGEFGVIGVMAAGMDVPNGATDLWFPLGIDRSQITDRSGHFLTVIGRLAPNGNLVQARAEMDATLVRWEEVYAGQHTTDPLVHPMTLVALDDQLFGGVRRAMFLLTAAVGLVLLLACANVANLLLARGEGRQREIALRAALGAGRARIGVQLLTESLVMSLLGGALGLAGSLWATRLLLALDPGGIPRLSQIGPDGIVVAFTAVLSVATGLVFGLLPAVRASRSDLTTVLNAGGRSGSSGRDTRRTLNGLVVAQVAVAVVLLIGSGLLVKSFVLLQRVDPGFVASNRLVFDVSLPARDYPDADRVLAFFETVTDRLEAVQGVEAVAMVRNLPLRAGSRQEGLLVEGRVQRIGADYQGVSSDYFTTLGIPVLRGRSLTDADRRGAPGVVLINETMARAYWPDDAAVGQRVKALFAGTDAEWLTVVGIVGDVRQNGLTTTPRPEVYLPAAQTPSRTFGWIRSMSFVVRTQGDPLAIASNVREVIRRVDPNIPVANLLPMQDVVAGTLRQTRFVMLLIAVFSGAALVIAAVGVYGVISFSVARRTSEIGIRMALGAQRSGVLGEVVRHGIRLAGIGAGIGLLLAFAGSRVLESQLYGVNGRDLFVFATGAIGLVVVAAVASLVPAYRASRVDPTQALRAE